MARIPKLRKKTRNRAAVDYRGVRYFFGEWGSAQADRDYRKWLARHAAGEFDQEDQPAPKRTMSVRRLAVRYLAFCEKHYSPAEFINIRESVRVVVKLFGKTPASNFDAARLLTTQSEMIRKNWRHRVINQRINRLRRWFRWAVSVVPAAGVTGTQCADLKTVDGLQPGKSNLQGLTPPASRAVPRVPWTVAELVLPFVSADIGGMVRIQYVCGMRPGEVVVMREIDIDTSGPVWFYTATEGTKRQEGSRVLEKAIPAIVQPVVREFFTADPSAYMFQPTRADRSNTSGVVGPHYTTASYRRAVSRGIARARRAGFDVPHWTPNRLRHAIGTDVSARLGQQAAQRWLGHDSLDTTAIYAEVVREELTTIAEHINEILCDG